MIRPAILIALSALALPALALDPTDHSADTDALAARQAAAAACVASAPGSGAGAGLVLTGVSAQALRASHGDAALEATAPISAASIVVGSASADACAAWVRLAAERDAAGAP